MDSGPETAQIAYLDLASRLATAAVVLLGGVVLLGWTFDIPMLKSVLPGWATMKANTAIGLVLSALVLTLRPRREQRWPRLAVRVCAAFVALLGALTLAEYVVGWDLRIDDWLFRESVEAAGTGQPGRMAPMTALAFVLLGLAELMLDAPDGVVVSQWLGVGVGFVGLLNLVGYLYRLQGLSELYSPPAAYTEMAVHTGAAFIGLGAAVLCARPDRGMMAILTSRSAGGLVARRLLPVALGLPLLLGWLRLLGERAGLWSAQAGWGGFGLAALAVFVLLIWRSARALHRTDGERHRAEVALRHAHDDLERQVEERTRALGTTVQALESEARERARAEGALRDSERRYRELVEASRGLICSHDLEGKLLSINAAAARLLGYAPAELVGRSVRDLLAASVQDRFSDYLERIRRAPTDEGLMRVVTRDGEERIWAYSNVRLEESGRAPYVLGHAQDITELKRAETLARQTEALRSVAQLANTAAHEINNPLGVVMGHLELLKRASSDPDGIARIEKATTAADRIRDIVAHMTNITRLERLEDFPELPPLLDLRRSGSPSSE